MESGMAPRFTSEEAGAASAMLTVRVASSGFPGVVVVKSPSTAHLPRADPIETSLAEKVSVGTVPSPEKPYTQRGTGSKGAKSLILGDEAWAGRWQPSRLPRTPFRPISEWRRYD